MLLAFLHFSPLFLHSTLALLSNAGVKLLEALQDCPLPSSLPDTANQQLTDHIDCAGLRAEKKLQHPEFQCWTVLAQPHDKSMSALTQPFGLPFSGNEVWRHPSISATPPSATHNPLFRKLEQMLKNTAHRNTLIIHICHYISSNLGKSN